MLLINRKWRQTTGWPGPYEAQLAPDATRFLLGSHVSPSVRQLLNIKWAITTRLVVGRYTEIWAAYFDLTKEKKGKAPFIELLLVSVDRTLREIEQHYHKEYTKH